MMSKRTDHRLVRSWACCLALLGTMVLGLSALAQSDEPANLTSLPEPPEPPPKVKSGEVLEPEVRIFRRAKERITEYRINGKVHLVKVEPDVGPVYYLVDRDGDGKLDSRHLGADFLVPMWELFRW